MERLAALVCALVVLLAAALWTYVRQAETQFVWRSEDGRAIVLDGIILAEDVSALQRLAAQGMGAAAGGDGGPTLLDLHSGAVSHHRVFVDVYRRAPNFNRSDLETYTRVQQRVSRILAERLSMDEMNCGLAAPAFFSRIDAAKPPVIENDEYYHRHVDKQTYGSFSYTSLIYLAQYGIDFGGGRFIILEPNERADELAARRIDTSSIDVVRAAIEPKPGRVVAFSSGAEHPHKVEQVEWGTRLALTIPFTCDRRNVQPFIDVMRETRHSIS